MESKLIRDRHRPGKSGGSSASSGKGAGSFYTDPVFIALYRDYETSARNLRRAVDEELTKWTAILNESSSEGPVEIRPGLGPRKYAAPDIYSLSTGSDINLYRINTLRRFYERDAYKVVTHRSGIKSPMPPDTLQRKLGALSKDAAFAQLVGKMDRAQEYIVEAQKEIGEVGAASWKAYEEIVYEPSRGANIPRLQLVDDETKVQLAGKYLIPIYYLSQVFCMELPVIAEECDSMTAAMTKPRKQPPR